jgi:dihydrofolate reductase
MPNVRRHLDGVIQAPGAPGEDPNSGFRLGGWATPYDDEAIGQTQQDLLAQPFELLLGRRTYDTFASFWPRVGPEAGNPIADLFNSVLKHVATHRPDTLDWITRTTRRVPLPTWIEWLTRILQDST